MSSPVVTITPGLKISTLDASAADFSFDGSLSWEQYLAEEDIAREQSGLNGRGGLGLTLNPRGSVSLKLSDNLDYTNEPPPRPREATYNRLVNRAGAEVGIQPGDRILQLGLGYEYGVYRYFTPKLRDLAKDHHNFNLDFTWRFLPKTAFVLQGRGSLIRYRRAERTDPESDQTIDNVDSTPIRVVGGISGLLSRRFSARLLGGYGTALYESGPTVSGPLARADLTYKYGPLSLDNELGLGYKFDFKDSSITNYFTSHQASLNWKQNFASKRFGLRAGAKYTRRDYSSLSATSDDIAGNQTADFSDNRIDANAGVQSEIFKWWSASLMYNYSQNISGGELVLPSANTEQQLRDFNRHAVRLSTTFRY